MNKVDLLDDRDSCWGKVFELGRGVIIKKEGRIKIKEEG
jgi:hypothetical protein